MAALGGSAPARRGVCVPRALLTQPPENVNVGRQAGPFLSPCFSLFYHCRRPRPFYLYRFVRPRARLEESNLRMTPSADYLSVKCAPSIRYLPRRRKDLDRVFSRVSKSRAEVFFSRDRIPVISVALREDARRPSALKALDAVRLVSFKETEIARSVCVRAHPNRPRLRETHPLHAEIRYRIPERFNHRFSFPRRVSPRSPPAGREKERERESSLAERSYH